MSANPLITTPGIHSGTFLHLYASDLSGSGATIDVSWWFVGDFHTTLSDMIQTAD